MGIAFVQRLLDCDSREKALSNEQEQQIEKAKQQLLCKGPCSPYNAPRALHVLPFGIAILDLRLGDLIVRSSTLDQDEHGLSREVLRL